MRDIKKEIDDAQACHPRKWGLQPPLTHATFLLTQGLVLTADYLRLTHYLCQAKCRRCDGAKRASLRGEVRELRKELNKRQQKSVRDLLMAAQIVLCTNTGAQDRALQLLPAGHAFDLVVIDEAAQAR